MLDELTLRRPEFREGVPVVLADGQAWHLRRPIVRFTPSESAAGFEVCLSLAGDDQYETLVRAADAAKEAVGPEGEGSFRVLAAELAMGRALLLANYALNPAQVASLLQFGFDAETDPDGVRIQSEVMAVAMGNDPKRSAGGGESPGTPPA